ncbi:5'-nucleotidase [Hondaea fermentalgiana]|uniref:5'-nucleotidase n=1 Tax=Hondaea fermentalgiana TaxID=2315210 RepID=A0A2R5GF60_9STRA|nr:5'-nucleotidase [Hondaea fermentalgiana]|eukprot:GBG29560.1 5'-nucleotidase [Hondaea fermentalgiana]
MGSRGGEDVGAEAAAQLRDLQLRVVAGVAAAENAADLELALREGLKHLQGLREREGERERERASLLRAKGHEAEETKEVHILHFNDVYNIAAREQEPVGGAARFVARVLELREKEDDSEAPLVLFSGDCLNPSMLSTTTRGAHMVPILNNACVSAACFGNHDFDFGIDQLTRLMANCEFPWITSNVRYRPDGGNLLAGAEEFLVIERADGLRIGIIGLVEYAWMATLSTIEEEDIEYEDFVECARRLGPRLRSQHRVHLVIALTHMRLPNDERLAHEAGDVVDLVLGGHDHDYEVRCVEPHKVWVIKSGTDFRELTEMRVRVTGRFALESDAANPERFRVEVVMRTRHEINNTIVPHERTQELVEMFNEKVAQDMNQVIGESAVPLDGIFAHIRTRETNLSNFVADIMRVGTRSEVAILNAGTLRLDAIVEAGTITLGDLRGILPMVDGLVVLEVPGSRLLEALENGVSKVPATEGRFPCVAGVSFTADYALEPMHRVSNVSVGGEPLEKDRLYRVCTKLYLANGKDGYSAFQDCKVLVDDECCPVLPTLVRNHFAALDVLNGFNCLSRRYGHTFMKAVHKLETFAKKKKTGALYVEPVVDGRITAVNLT